MPLFIDHAANVFRHWVHDRVDAARPFPPPLDVGPVPLERGPRGVHIVRLVWRWGGVITPV